MYSNVQIVQTPTYSNQNYKYIIMNKRELNTSKWLDAHCDRNVRISILPRSALFIDVSGDDDYQIIAADFNYNRLRTYKQNLMSDILLRDVPNSLIMFYANQSESKVPAIGVACGRDLFIYKNNKPFFKFQLPPSIIVCKELEQCIMKASPRIQVSSMSPRDLTKKDGSGFKISPITCMCTLKQSSHDKSAVACPVVANESGNIYFLDPQSLLVLHQANTCDKKSTPFILYSTGLFDDDFKIVIACREGHICVLMKGWLEGKSIIEMTENIVDMVIVPGDNFIVIASNQKRLYCFTKRGQNLWITKTSHSVTCISVIPINHLNINLIAVGLRNSSIQLYYGRYLVDYITVPESPSTIIFGQLGQEDNVMVVITLRGTISYKILKRTSDFSVRYKEENLRFQCKPIPLPKRTKLFLEGSLRERSILAVLDIYRHFQEDLMLLRLNSALDLMSSISNLECRRVLKIEAKILGLEPKFKITLTIENISTDKSVKGLIVIFHTAPSLFCTASNIIEVPTMPPCYCYKMKIEVQKIKNTVHSPILLPIKIYIVKQFQLAVAIDLPLNFNY